MYVQNVLENKYDAVSSIKFRLRIVVVWQGICKCQFQNLNSWNFAKDNTTNTFAKLIRYTYR